MKPISCVLLMAIVVGSSSVVQGGGLLGLQPGLNVADLYRGDEVSAGLTLAGDRLQALAAPGPTPAVGLASAVAPMSLGAEGGHVGSYIAGRVGPLWFIEDLEDLDVGLNAELAFGYRVLPFLAFEIQSGYLWGEVDDTVDGELWGVPIVANVKLIIPILILEIYAGVGIGGYYIDTEATLANVSIEEEDFVFGGNAFVGVGVVLGPVTLAVEGKYIQTVDFDAAALGEAQLQAFAAMGSLTLHF